MAKKIGYSGPVNVTPETTGKRQPALLNGVAKSHDFSASEGLQNTICSVLAREEHSEIAMSLI